MICDSIPVFVYLIEYGEGIFKYIYSTVAMKYQKTLPVSNV